MFHFMSAKDEKGISKQEKIYINTSKKDETKRRNYRKENMKMITISLKNEQATSTKILTLISGLEIYIVLITVRLTIATINQNKYINKKLK